MGVPNIAGKYILVNTPESVYAGRVSSVGEAGDAFTHHELYVVFSELKKFSDRGCEDVKGNFAGVKDLFVGSKWHEVYSLDGNRKGILKSIEDEGRITQGIKSGLKCEYSAE